MFQLNLQAIEQIRRHMAREQDLNLTLSKLSDRVLDQVAVLNRMEWRRAQTE